MHPTKFIKFYTNFSDQSSVESDPGQLEGGRAELVPPDDPAPPGQYHVSQFCVAGTERGPVGVRPAVLQQGLRGIQIWQGTKGKRINI